MPGGSPLHLSAWRCSRRPAPAHTAPFGGLATLPWSGEYPAPAASIIRGLVHRRAGCHLGTPTELYPHARRPSCGRRQIRASAGLRPDPRLFGGPRGGLSSPARPGSTPATSIRPIRPALEHMAVAPPLTQTAAPLLPQRTWPLRAYISPFPNDRLPFPLFDSGIRWGHPHLCKAHNLA